MWHPPIEPPYAVRCMGKTRDGERTKFSSAHVWHVRLLTEQSKLVLHGDFDRFNDDVLTWLDENVPRGEWSYEIVSEDFPIDFEVIITNVWFACKKKAALFKLFYY